MQKVGENTIVGASGDLSDYQKIMKNIHEMQTYDMANDDGCSMTPRDFHQYMGRVMYNRSLLLKVVFTSAFFLKFCGVGYWICSGLSAWNISDLTCGLMLQA